jgi:D-amino-acid dehydrogenase
LFCAAGAQALMRKSGWIEIYPRARDLVRAINAADALRVHGLRHDVLDRVALRAREPHLSKIAGAIHWRDPVTSSDPGGLTRAYAALFVARGGTLMKADALTLARTALGWSVGEGSAACTGAEVVAALGPWSGDLCQRLGYRFPLAFKRGYHMHYAVDNGRGLDHPVCDPEAGYVLSPMRQGIRLTTGVELAERDAPGMSSQLVQAETSARRLFPLGRALDPEPWRGSRPCLPDMKPIIGKAAHHPGFWFAFGHAHHGFTLGPVTGRLLAEMMTGETPFTDPAPYAAERFGGGRDR